LGVSRSGFFRVYFILAIIAGMSLTLIGLQLIPQGCAMNISRCIVTIDEIVLAMVLAGPATILAGLGGLAFTLRSGRRR